MTVDVIFKLILPITFAFLNYKLNIFRPKAFLQTLSMAYYVLKTQSFGNRFSFRRKMQAYSGGLIRRDCTWGQKDIRIPKRDVLIA